MQENFCIYCLLSKECRKPDHDKLLTPDISYQFCGMNNRYNELNCFANSALQAM